MQTQNLVKAAAIILPVGLIVSAGAAFAFSIAAAGIPAATIQEATDATPPATRPATRPTDSYPLDVCVVSGGKLGSMGEPPIKQIDGRTVKVCCAACFPAFEKDKEKYHAKMDQLIIEAQSESYPLQECLVSGEDLDAMGEPLLVVHRATNQLVKFCCGSCEAAFKKSPEKFLAKLNAAREKTETK